MFKTLLILLATFTLHAQESNTGKPMKHFYDFEAQSIKDKTISMSTYKGKVVLVVNVASKCNFTPQYAGLESLYRKYHDQGFEILGFPSNQFHNQEPGTAKEIQNFCKLNYGVSFPLFAKIKVNGDHTHPLFQFLKSEATGFFGTESIKWNFTKFLIDKEGNVITRYGSTTKPKSIVSDIEKLLKR